MDKDIEFHIGILRQALGPLRARAIELRQGIKSTSVAYEEMAALHPDDKRLKMAVENFVTAFSRSEEIINIIEAISAKMMDKNR